MVLTHWQSWTPVFISWKHGLETGGGNGASTAKPCHHGRALVEQHDAQHSMYAVVWREAVRRGWGDLYGRMSTEEKPGRKPSTDGQPMSRMSQPCRTRISSCYSARNDSAQYWNPNQTPLKDVSKLFPPDAVLATPQVRFHNNDDPKYRPLLARHHRKDCTCWPS